MCSLPGERRRSPAFSKGWTPRRCGSLRLVDADLLLTVEGGDIWIEGSFEAEGEGFCDRCSDPVTLRLGKGFRTFLTPKSRDRAPAGSVELHEEDLDVGYYDGTGVETNDILWEQVALELPMQVVCSEACRGVCPVCGKNRNLEECSCVAGDAPGPFEILKNLKGKKE